jgi:hypothetical protein
MLHAEMRSKKLLLPVTSFESDVVAIVSHCSSLLTTWDLALFAISRLVTLFEILSKNNVEAGGSGSRESCRGAGWGINSCFAVIAIFHAIVFGRLALAAVAAAVFSWM